MADMNYEKIMDILDDVRVKEFACAEKTWVLMKKTLNPFKRIMYKKSHDRFMDHVVGIQLAINRINKEIKS